jgi:uncharacterized membrane protein HdeD (DUF308 family)
MSADWSIENEGLRGAMARALREHWALFLVEGIVLLILGILAVVVPPLATLAFTVFLGWLFVISGVFGLVSTFGARYAPGFWWSLVSSVLALAAGILMILLPASGAISLTLILTVFFILDGVASIMYALDHRQQLTRQWGWLLAVGVCDLAVAGVIIAGFPGTVAWVLGLLVGINMLFSGTALIMIALYARTSAPDRSSIGVAYRR